MFSLRKKEPIRLAIQIIIELINSSNDAMEEFRVTPTQAIGYLLTYNRFGKVMIEYIYHKEWADPYNFDSTVRRMPVNKEENKALLKAIEARKTRLNEGAETAILQSITQGAQFNEPTVE